MPDDDDDDEIWNRREVAQAATISASTIDRLLKQQAFPAPIRLSKRRVGWRASAVRAWLAERPPAR
jgi:prophage regulatory protein